jgi:hypothetical protein
MIDYDRPDQDPIVAEVRRVREQLAAEFNYDLRAIFKEMRRRQNAAGRKHASPPTVKPTRIKATKMTG